MTRPVAQSVTQDWVQELSFMQQTVLLTAVRGPDGIGKYHPCKYLLRWFRRCILWSALDRCVWKTPYEAGGGSFTGPSFEMVGQYEPWSGPMDELVSQYLRSIDELPHHFQMHFMHAAEILGYKHPDHKIRDWWCNVYFRLVHDLHLYPEMEEHMDLRLGDNREQWLSLNDPATVD